MISLPSRTPTADRRRPAAAGAAGQLARDGLKDAMGGAALIVLVPKVTPDKVPAQISQYGGDKLQTSPDAATRLREVLEGQHAAAPVA